MNNAARYARLRALAATIPSPPRGDFVGARRTADENSKKTKADARLILNRAHEAADELHEAVEKLTGREKHHSITHSPQEENHVRPIRNKL